MTVEFRLIGAVGAWVDGTKVDLGSSRQRCVLAALLMDANRVVPAGQLQDRVWGEDPPPTARETLHSYISRLRRVLARADGLGLAWESGGYLVTVDEASIDVFRFRRLVTEARAADDEDALSLFEQALRLWRGEPFAGLDALWFSGVRAAMDSERFAAELDRNDAELRLGRHARRLPELTTRVREHPLDERLAGQFMLALHQSGRQAEALEHYRVHRVRLADEVGADPDAALTELHQRILRGDPELAPRKARSPKRVLRRNDLPGNIADFTGRDKEIARLLAAVPEDGQPGVAMVIEAIDGMAGVGKTTLAVRLAHQLADRYPDAQLFIDLHGHTASHEATAPTDALDALLRAVGVPGDQIPHQLAERAARWRAELADRSAVVVLDNAADAAQVRPLLPSGAGCLTLITSRRRLVDLDAARILSLDVLPRADAITLFLRVVDNDRIAADPGPVDEVVALCGDLPLAIRIAAARLRTRPAWTVRHLAGRLHDRYRRLAELTVGDRSVAAAFAISYDHLTADQQRMFRLLGLHPGPDIDVCAAASLTGTSPAEAERLLEDLVDVCLLQQHEPGRYRLHDLLRHHANTTAHDAEPAAHQQDALRRLVDFYLHTAFNAERLLEPHRPPIQLAQPAAGCHPQPVSEQSAVAWFVAEHPNLLAAQHLAVEWGWHPAAWQLAWTLTTFHHRRGHLHHDLAVWQVGLAATHQARDAGPQIMAHRLLGHAHARAEQHADAEHHLQQALGLAEHTDDRPAQVHTRHALVLAYIQQGDDKRALEHATHALRVSRTIGNPAWEGRELNAVGWCHAQLGDYEQARTYCEEALALFRHHQYRDGEANTLDSLGYLTHRAGQHDQARHYYEQALSLARELGHAYLEADTLDRIGQTYHALALPEDARTAWKQALRLYQTQHRTAAADRVQRLLDSAPSRR